MTHTTSAFQIGQEVRYTYQVAPGFRAMTGTGVVVGITPDARGYFVRRDDLPGSPTTLALMLNEIEPGGLF